MPVVALVVTPVIAPVVVLIVAPLLRPAFASPILSRDNAAHAKANHGDGSSQQ
jgi:hypothetical protein